MRTLRVLVTDPPADAAPWRLVDERGAIVDQGRGPSSSWPRADRREAVIAASAARVLSLALPPLPAARVTTAARYALEERLATPLESSVVVAGPQAGDGRVAAIVVPKSAASLLSSTPRFDRIVAEPALAAPPEAQAWRWCASEGHGFVVTGEGDTFAVGAAVGDALPDELRIALEQAARRGSAPMRVLAAVPGAESRRAAWTRACGVPFEPDTPWRWDAGDAAGAADLAPALGRALAPAIARPSSRLPFAAALGMLAAAGALFLVASAGTWAWRKMELARAQDELVAVARDAGVRDEDSTTAARALARLHAEVRHRAGASVDADAWPLLARAAPALAMLPAGTLRSARYGSGAWTLELAPLDDDALGLLDARLRSVGVAGVSARTGSGLRMRIELGG